MGQEVESDVLLTEKAVGGSVDNGAVVFKSHGVEAHEVACLLVGEVGGAGVRHGGIGREPAQAERAAYGVVAVGIDLCVGVFAAHKVCKVGVGSAGECHVVEADSYALGSVADVKIESEVGVVVGSDA